MRYLTAFLFCLSLKASGQVNFIKTEWTVQPALHKVDPKFQDEAAVFIKDNKRIEFANEKQGFFMYKTIHSLVHINTDKGIEYFNKIYLPFEEGQTVMEVGARTILPNGKIIELNEKNIKDLEEENRKYKIFALDGLTKGCEVEYFYTIKKFGSYFGREFLSQSVPVQSSLFQLISPDYLKFEIKNYNASPNVTDTTYDGKSYLAVNASGIESDKTEAYSMHDASLKRVEYKLSYNKAKSSNERLFTWNELAQKVYDIYIAATEKEFKKVKEVVDNAGVTAAMKEEEKIVKLENYFKKNFISRDDISYEDATDLGTVIKNRVSSERAYCRLFAIALSVANVNYQIVLSGDRSDYVVEKNLENWNNSKNFLFYFPGTRKYLAPTHVAYRYPWIPPTWGETNGVHCVVTTLGNFKSAFAEVRNIPLENFKYSFSDMAIKAKLNDQLDELQFDVKQSYGGYMAVDYKAPYIFSPAEEQEKILNAMVKFGSKPENLKAHSFENKELEQKDFYQPFVINATVHAEEMVEQAGSKIIIKVGELIGQQSQMYDEKERKNNIELGYPHTLGRTIEIAIPDGYEIKNPQDLLFNEVYKENDKVIIGFVSSYVIDKGVLKITIDETYAKSFYPVQQYNDFKKVINSAADFNKVVLVLDKKK